MSDLSPAAQAAVNAAVDVTGYGRATRLLHVCIAAALRAAVNHVLPIECELVDGHLQYEKRDPIRDEFLAIAEELENTND